MLTPLTSSIIAAEPVVEWATAVDSGGENNVYGMALDTNGAIYVVGNSRLCKFDQSGKLIRDADISALETHAIAVDPNGNYYLTGMVREPETLGVGQKTDFYVGKHKSDGAPIWQRSAGLETAVRGYYQFGDGMVLDPAGNLYIAGASSGAAVFEKVRFPDGPGGPLLCKYDPNGTLLWAKRVEVKRSSGTGMGGNAGDIALDAEGNIIVCGYLYNGTADFGGTSISVGGLFGAEFYLAKYTPGGDLQWVRLGYGYGGIAVDGPGNIYFNGNVVGKSVLHCGKVSPAGDLLWDRTISGQSGVEGRGVALTPNGEPVFVGEFEGTAEFDAIIIANDTRTEQKSFIAKVDQNGNFQWALGDTGRALARATKVLSDPAGAIYVAGDVRCIWRDGWLCEPGVLGSFSLNPQPDGQMTTFLARLSDPDAVTNTDVLLEIRRNGSQLSLTWPATAGGFVLESSTAAAGTAWPTVSTPIIRDGSINSVSLELGPATRLFRLRRQ